MFFITGFSLWHSIGLVALVCVVYFLWYRRNVASMRARLGHPELPPLKKQDMSMSHLRQFDGRSPDGRILVGCSGRVFDVTRAGNFYGPDGPYGCLAGRDASRALATFNLEESSMRDDFDDLSDLGPSEVGQLREWTAQFQEKYPVIGRLLKPGEVPDHYSDSDTDDEQLNHSTTPRTLEHKKGL